MNASELRSTVIEILQSIAPELDEALLRDNRPLRLQVDQDSMDWLNFLIGLSQRLKVAIAESDYGQLVTLNDVLAYLQARLPKGHAGA